MDVDAFNASVRRLNVLLHKEPLVKSTAAMDDEHYEITAGSTLSEQYFIWDLTKTKHFTWLGSPVQVERYYERLSSLCLTAIT